MSAFAANFGAAIELDQKVYTWTDKVRITVVAPDFSRDPNKIEKVGNGNGTINIKTRMGKIENYELIETGKNTGIFTGEFVLTGFMHQGLPDTIPKNFGKTFGQGPRDGCISTDSDDGLTIEFKTKNETIVASALIRWNIGEVKWKKDNYTMGDTGSFLVIDPDVNLDPNSSDVFLVRIWSDSDPVGIVMPVVETGVETGIFFGDVHFGVETEDAKSIKVSSGDSVIVEYADYTLPDPYQKGDTLKIIATTQIISK